MSSKHLSNDIHALVQGALTSLTIVNPRVSYDPANKTVYDSDAIDSPNVAVVSGGGSGHEPAFAGFVGGGFLSAAVAGSIFASPSADQVYRCLTRLGAAHPGRGILIVIMNYTGDKLHFGMAIEKARAQGIEAELLVVYDDVGVGRSRSGRIGRRGLAGTVLVQKIAAALAAEGASLSEVYKVASLAASNVATVGASLAHVHVPGRAVSTDELSTNDKIEIGMGIHNEEGFGRVKTDLRGLVKALLEQLLDTTDKDRGFMEIAQGVPVVLLVNNLGGISPLELGAATLELVDQLDQTYGIFPVRVLSGTYMSSLNGLGFSATLLKVVDDKFVELLDTAVSASGWLPPAPAENWSGAFRGNIIKEDIFDLGTEGARSNLRVDYTQVQGTLTKALTNMIQAEPEVTKYDTLVGDGDCGLCLKTGAEAVLSHIQSLPSSSSTTPSSDAVQLVTGIAHVIEKSMDGTSGALYSIFVNALAAGLREQDSPSSLPSESKGATATVWGTALTKALQTLCTYTPAKPGDRTVVDTLQPFSEVFAATGDLVQAVDAAQKGCDSTKGIEASLGRSVYVGGEEWKNCPDPGAYGLLAFLRGFLG
ncbi:Dak1 domain-containing protein [Xylariaceae sp. FL0594]|nr:Dak1 domain-containing protein [Xylariaceae sp. FL0594]